MMSKFLIIVFYENTVLGFELRQVFRKRAISLRVYNQTNESQSQYSSRSVHLCTRKAYSMVEVLPLE